jgi:hypothetical protein
MVSKAITGIMLKNTGNQTRAALTTINTPLNYCRDLEGDFFLFCKTVRKVEIKLSCEERIKHQHLIFQTGSQVTVHCHSTKPGLNRRATTIWVPLLINKSLNTCFTQIPPSFSGKVPVRGPCEHDNEQGSITHKKTFD